MAVASIVGGIGFTIHSSVKGTRMVGNRYGVACRACGFRTKGQARPVVPPAEPWGGLERLLEVGRQVSKLLEDGAIGIPRLETLTLGDANDALMAMRAQRTVGKRVVLLSS